jgi:hypothetical protein
MTQQTTFTESLVRGRCSLWTRSNLQKSFKFLVIKVTSERGGDAAGAHGSPAPVAMQPQPAPQKGKTGSEKRISISSAHVPQQNRLYRVGQPLAYSNRLCTCTYILINTHVYTYRFVNIHMYVYSCIII